MKTTIIPAQITTVEDRIAGNLNFPQILLLVIAFGLSMAIYSFMPPKTGWSLEKICTMAAIASSISVLAIRVKQKIILEWIVVIARYMMRPRWYVANKNDVYGRIRTPVVKKTSHVANTVATKPTQKMANNIANSISDFEHFVQKADSIRIKPKKGGIHVALG